MKQSLLQFLRKLFPKRNGVLLLETNLVRWLTTVMKVSEAVWWKGKQQITKNSLFHSWFAQSKITWKAVLTTAVKQKITQSEYPPQLICRMSGHCQNYHSQTKYSPWFRLKLCSKMFEFLVMIDPISNFSFVSGEETNGNKIQNRCTYRSRKKCNEWN